MSNRFKFRVWDVKGKCFRGNLNEYFIERETGDIHTRLYSDIYEEYYFDKEDSLISQQFTSYLDKNGREIYEGDIVKKHDGIECFVCFDRGCFCLRVLADPHKCCCLKEIEKSHLLEISGNIYENPDKLTGFAKSFI